ncbi:MULTISPECIES: helix-turn-helix domain-containing protein [Empedobacter]|uniref:Helix-turn-helix domain-containing protein n=1 Tax=Empedobacter falsenii TaxID=343874 RepID=A0A7H9DTG1_9FLAO|nr:MULTISPECIES: helix-turn-helix domain-containing protein [Empedobacter]MDH2208451.1 helix-turn-helix domain-containing protein [Empedobacter sp. GD03644]QLL58335.1 helix-turn-helix domain-containing protein [Empedobacter falsenii]
MDQQIPKITPNYKQIYFDLVVEKFPTKLKFVKNFLEKESFSSLDIIRVNKIIFNTSYNIDHENQKHRAYEKSDIIYMLNYQEEHKLSNSTVAKHFKVSRNSISKWKKMLNL